MKKFYKILLSIGVAVGVFCSLLVFTIGQNQWTAIKVRDKALESDILKIVRSSEPYTINYLSLIDVGELEGYLPSNCIVDVKAPAHGTVITYEGEPLPIEGVIGTGQNLSEIMGFQFIKGRFFSKKEIEEGQKVCVIGSKVYDLIRTRKASHIQMNGESYEIIGVVEEIETAERFHQKEDVYIPITTLYQSIEKTSNESQLIHQMILNRGDYTKEQVAEIMQQKALELGMDISSLKVMPYDADEFNDSNQFMKEFTLVFLLSLMVLLIASFNIIHIASASIMDREREIGLRTALGAKKKHIIAQIAKEIFICSIRGGIAGVAAVSVVNTITNITFNRYLLSFNGITIGAGILLAFVAGSITSILPAGKAAKLDPISALREE
ncbi:MAG: hypothetical protein K0S47_709 [Herbinix sp.]|nr:hypothetical protein [Herbinix sp.]